MNEQDYIRCAARITDALQLVKGEHVLLKLDPRVFGDLVAPLQQRIRAAGAVISGVVLAEDTMESSADESRVLEQLFSDADVFIWLPELNQGNRPALAQAINRWLDAKRGRAVHFHWHSGSYTIGSIGLPPQQRIDEMYMEALGVSTAELSRRHSEAIALLRSAPIRVTSEDGTDIRFEAGDRPFCSQIGDASRRRMESAVTRIDRDVELPAGVLRVAPIENTANGCVVLSCWQPVRTKGDHLRLSFQDGTLIRIDGDRGADILSELSAAGCAARRFREFALGFNPALRVRPDHPFIAYYGYGSGVVRLSLGDNEEMGGANRGGGVYWNFIHNATVSAGSRELVRNGVLKI